jgi:hypothetical protein
MSGVATSCSSCAEPIVVSPSDTTISTAIVVQIRSSLVRNSRTVVTAFEYPTEPVEMPYIPASGKGNTTKAVLSRRKGRH